MLPATQVSPLWQCGQMTANNTLCHAAMFTHPPREGRRFPTWSFPGDGSFACPQCWRNVCSMRYMLSRGLRTTLEMKHGASHNSGFNMGSTYLWMPGQLTPGREPETTKWLVLRRVPPPKGLTTRRDRQPADQAPHLGACEVKCEPHV
jgi:hypothetical protein